MQVQPSLLNKLTLPSVQYDQICAQNLNKYQNIRAQQITSEEQRESNDLFLKQNFLRRYDIIHAQLSGDNFDVLLAIKKHTFVGQVDEKNRKMTQWLKQYFKNNNIDIIDGYFTPRKNINPTQNTEFFPTKFLVYGVDLIQTHNIINKYTRWNPIVSWIDASHCQLLFADETKSRIFILKNIKDKDYIVMTEKGGCPILKEWRQFQGYSYLNFKRSIYVRHLSSDDQIKKNDTSNNDDMLEKFKQTVKNIQKELLQDNNMRQLFQQSLDEDIAMKAIGPNFFKQRKRGIAEKMGRQKKAFIDGNFQEQNKQTKKKFNDMKVILEEEPHYEKYSLKYYEKFYNPDFQKVKRFQNRYNIDPNLVVGGHEKGNKNGRKKYWGKQRSYQKRRGQYQEKQQFVNTTQEKKSRNIDTQISSNIRRNTVVTQKKEIASRKNNLKESEEEQDLMEQIVPRNENKRSDIVIKKLSIINKDYERPIFSNRK